MLELQLGAPTPGDGIRRPEHAKLALDQLSYTPSYSSKPLAHCCSPRPLPLASQSRVHPGVLVSDHGNSLCAVWVTSELSPLKPMGTL